MKKSHVFLGFISVLVLTLYLMVPVTATGSVVGWKNIPLSDPENDVWSFETRAKPWTGVKGDYHDEIDLKSVAIEGNDLVLEFYDVPKNDTTYVYEILIDTDSDGRSDFDITKTFGNAFWLVETAFPNRHWNGTDWVVIASFPHSIIGNKLYLTTVKTAINVFADLAFSKLALNITYTGAAPDFYADYAPSDPSGIPSFTFVLIIFGLIITLAIVIVQRKNKISI